MDKTSTITVSFRSTSQQLTLTSLSDKDLRALISFFMSQNEVQEIVFKQNTPITKS